MVLGNPASNPASKIDRRQAYLPPVHHTALTLMRTLFCPPLTTHTPPLHLPSISWSPLASQFSVSFWGLHTPSPVVLTQTPQGALQVELHVACCRQGGAWGRMLIKRAGLGSAPRLPVASQAARRR